MSADTPLYTLQLPPVSNQMPLERDKNCDRLEIICDQHESVVFKCEWHEGKRHGTARALCNGRIIHEITFANGLRQGPEIVRNYSGQIIYQAHWLDNRLSGLCTLFMDNGKTVIAKRWFVDGRARELQFSPTLGNAQEMYDRWQVPDLDPHNTDLVTKLLLDVVQYAASYRSDPVPFVSPVASPVGSPLASPVTSPRVSPRPRARTITGGGSVDAAATSLRSSLGKLKQLPRSRSGSRTDLPRSRAQSTATDDAASVVSSSSTMRSISTSTASTTSTNISLAASYAMQAERRRLADCGFDPDLDETPVAVFHDDYDVDQQSDDGFSPPSSPKGLTVDPLVEQARLAARKNHHKKSHKSSSKSSSHGKKEKKR